VNALPDSVIWLMSRVNSLAPDEVWYNLDMNNADKNEIILFEGQGVRLKVNMRDDNVWLTANQMAQLFDRDEKTIRKHINSVFRDKELTKNINTQKMRVDGVKQPVAFYSLDTIISVGYRVNSKKATKFRIWATSVLKEYAMNGVAVNERRIAALALARDENKLKNVENMLLLAQRLATRSALDAGEARGILEVISRYANSFRTLKEFDAGHIDINPTETDRKIKILDRAQVESAIKSLKQEVGGDELLGKKRGDMLDGSLAAIFQSFNGKELYPTIEEKAANLLYFVVKDHPFYDGNKRIGALLFILFLTINNSHTDADGRTKISEQALTAITLLIAESKPTEKDLIISLVCRLLE